MEATARQIRRLLWHATQCGRFISCCGVRFLIGHLDRTAGSQGDRKGHSNDSENVYGFAKHISTPVLTGTQIWASCLMTPQLVRHTAAVRLGLDAFCPPRVGAHYVLPPCTNHLHFRKMYVACGEMASSRAIELMNVTRDANGLFRE